MASAPNHGPRRSGSLQEAETMVWKITQLCARAESPPLAEEHNQKWSSRHFRAIQRAPPAFQNAHSRMDLERLMRFQALDGWRGVCAVAVALFHLNVYSHIHDLSLIRHAYLFVDFFFVLSGFVIASAYLGSLNSDRDVWTFLLRRFGRLWPLHCSLLMVFVLLEFMKSVAMGMGAAAAEVSFSEKTSTFAIFTNIFMIHSLGLHSSLTWNIPSWSISVEFYAYVFFAATIAVFHGRRSALIATFIACAIVSILAVAYACRHGQDTTYAYGFFRCLSGFLCGVLAFLTYTNVASGAKYSGTLWELAALATTIVFVCFFGGLEYSFAASLVFSAVVFVYARQKGSLSRLMCLPVFRKLGDWSYSIYMVNYLVSVNIVERPAGIVQKLTGWPLTANLDAISNGAYGPGAGQIIALGGKYQADLLTLVYVSIVIFVARQTYVFIELPCRSYFNSLASRTAHSWSQLSLNADHARFPTGRADDGHTQATP
jgi:peptidoglycan/LPS O-acetylase OafA/YrhL